MNDFEYIVKAIEPTLFNNISKIDILQTNKEIDKKYEPANFQYSEEVKAADNKKKTTLHKKNYTIHSHYLVLPMIIYLANIRNIKNSKFNNDVMCEMEALVRASNNKYAKEYKWLYDSINELNLNPSFYVIQYYYNQLDRRNPIVFIHDSTEEKEKTFETPQILTLEKFRDMCLLGKEVGCYNMFLISKIQYIGKKQ